VQANGVRRRNNCTGDDVVAVHQRASNRLTDTIDVHGRGSDEGDDEAGGGGKQGWYHQDAEPAYIEAVVGDVTQEQKRSHGEALELLCSVVVIVGMIAMNWI
jgi:hypothetical protein